MSEAKHTPGPWAHINPDGFTVRHPQVYSDTGPVCNATWLGDVRIDELRANARLISAAPEMLEALNLCRQHMYEHASNTPDNAFEKLCAAIAKATGQA